MADIKLVEQAMMVVRRLERLSADSIYAHISCGYRGALLQAVDEIEAGQAGSAEVERLEWLIRQGFNLLENAARELVVPEDI
jgi:hypothetical protein